MMNRHAITATWRRQLMALLSNPLAYIFILAFVMATAMIMFLGDDFFKRNIADFEPLRIYMLYPLVILIPALAMGSWASERELGTEEQLLSLPMSLADVLFGKWLGIASFFTLTLICSWCNVFIVSWLGEPDLGQILALYVGWWFAGLFFVSLSILASSLVSMPAIGFVLGVALSVLGALSLHFSNWLDPFGRGLFPLPSILMVLLFIVAPLALAGMLLSLRRWQKKYASRFMHLIITVVCLCVVAFNVAVLLDRLALDVDVTQEHLSSLSPASEEVLDDIERQVDVVVFISSSLPSAALENKAREVETMLQSIDRSNPQKIHIEIKRPTDALDEIGIEASEHYGLQPRRVIDDSVTGKQEVEVFLGAVVRSAAKTQVIEHFDPGLSVEYEMIRAIRAVGHEKRKVIGVVDTDFHALGGFDYQSRQMRKEWDLMSELRKQYEMRNLTLNTASEPDSDVDVLLVIQPSRLKQEQIERLHDLIWSGTPALMMEDPLPMFAGPELGSSQAQKPPQQNPMQPQQQAPEPKGDLMPLLHALGVFYNPNEMLWSAYNPSHEFRNMPREFVWTSQSTGGVNQDAVICTGVNGLLLPFAGSFISAADVQGLQVTPLISVAANSLWGSNTWDDHFQQSYFGLQQKQAPYRPSFGPAPMMAVEVSGTMKRVYAGPALESSMQAETSTDAQKAAQTDTDTSTLLATGTPSKLDVHVVLIADTDFVHDQFFSIYRNENAQYSADALAVFHSLRNVQFIANAIDDLAGDTDFLSLRTRRARARPLSWLDSILQNQRDARVAAINKAEEDATAEIESLNQRMQEKIESIKQLSEDVNAKRQRVAQVEQLEGRKTKHNIERANRKKDKAIREADIKERRAVQAARAQVKFVALGLPAIILCGLIAIVFFLRLRDEKSAVPTERRKRNQA